jgi:hypothetical protein
VRRAASLRQGIGCREVSNLRSPCALSDLVVNKRLDLVDDLLYTLRQSLSVDVLQIPYPDWLSVALLQRRVNLFLL